MDAVSGAMSAIFELVSTIAGLLVDGIKAKMEENKAFIQAALDALKIIFSSAWSVISNGVQFTLNLIKTIFTTFFNVVQNLAKAWTAVLKGDWKGALDFLKTAATTALDGVKQIFTSFKDSLTNVFKGIKESMLNWGKDMIANLISGIKSKIGDVAQSMADVANTIKQYIHFTEPDIGPLSDFHTYAPDMMKEFAQGLIGSTDILTSAVSDAFDLKPYIMSLDRSARTMASNTAPDVISSANGNVNVIVTLQGDADRLFRVMSYEAQRNRQITGQSALAGF